MKKNNQKTILLLLLLPTTAMQAGWFSDAIAWIFKPVVTYAKESPKTFTALVGCSAVALFTYARAHTRKSLHAKIQKQWGNAIADTQYNKSRCQELSKDIANTNAQIAALNTNIARTKQETAEIEQQTTNADRRTHERASAQKQAQENIRMTQEEFEQRKLELATLKERKAQLERAIIAAQEDGKKYTQHRNTLAQATVEAITQQNR